MWLVDPWFADQRQLVQARRIEFHDRIAGTSPAGPADPIAGERHRAGARRDPDPRRVSLGLLTAVASQLAGSSALASRVSACRTRSPSYVVHIGGRLARRNAP